MSVSSSCGPLLAVFLLVLSGCGGDDSATTDTGTPADSSTADTSPPPDGSVDSSADGGGDRCGDGTCGSSEECDTCSEDCGACGEGIRAASCERDDVAAAIASASDGLTVVIPAGRCAWTSGLEISGKGIRLTAETADAVTLVHDAGSGTLIAIGEDDSHRVELDGIIFEEGSGGAEAWDGMFVNVNGGAEGRPVLVHHNTFEFHNASRRAIRWGTNRGVLWANTFDGDGNDVNAIVVVDDGDTASWTTPPTMGMADTAGESNFYIEDNTFRQIPFQALDPDSNSRVVIRHNTFDNSAMSSHGADTSEHGTRHWELYDNTFIFDDMGDCDGSLTTNLPYLFYIRGGSGVIADNVIPDMNSCAWGDKAELYMTVQNLRRNSGPNPCWDTYPAPHQVGQGHDGGAAVTDPVYLWGNTGGGNYDAPAIGDYDPDECGGGPSSTDFIQAGRDFITGTPRPGYTKYTHPHPLRGGR